jgi:amino-acid N-acetyltransferase
MTVTAVLREAAPGDRAPILELLAAGSLPTADLADADWRDFIVAIDGGRLVGVVGCERHGDVGLLRSLAVAPGRRDQGLGGTLVDAVEARAADERLRSLWLLTTSAARFFAARGYQHVDRRAAPTPLARSSQFTDACPATAACMFKPMA